MSALRRTNSFDKKIYKYIPKDQQKFSLTYITINHALIFMLIFKIMPPLSCICIFGIQSTSSRYKYFNKVKQEALIFVIPPPWFYFLKAHKTFYCHYKHTIYLVQVLHDPNKSEITSKRDYKLTKYIPIHKDLTTDPKTAKIVSKKSSNNFIKLF